MISPLFTNWSTSRYNFSIYNLKLSSPSFWIHCMMMIYKQFYFQLAFEKEMVYSVIWLRVFKTFKDFDHYLWGSWVYIISMNIAFETELCFWNRFLCVKIWRWHVWEQDDWKLSEIVWHVLIIMKKMNVMV